MLQQVDAMFVVFDLNTEHRTEAIYCNMNMNELECCGPKNRHLEKKL